MHTTHFIALRGKVSGGYAYSTPSQMPAWIPYPWVPYPRYPTSQKGHGTRDTIPLKGHGTRDQKGTITPVNRHIPVKTLASHNLVGRQ